MLLNSEYSCSCLFQPKYRSNRSTIPQLGRNCTFFHRLLYIINIKRVHRFSGLEIQFCSIFTVTGQQRGNYELQEVRQNYPESLYMPKKENVSLQQIDFRNRLALVLRLSLMPTQKTGYILTSLTCPPFFHRLFHIYKIKNGHLDFWTGNMPELSDQE